MVLAAAGAYSCPYATAAGMQTFGQYSGDGGITQVNAYSATQSTDNIGFTKPGQETLYNSISDGIVTIGRSGTRYNATIDANDHQIYKGDKSVQYLDGGMTWDAALTAGARQPMNRIVEERIMNYANGTNGTYNYTPGDTVANTTIFQRPYEETMKVEKTTMGNKGTYVSDKVIEQGSNESQDYIMLNAHSTGMGQFSNNVEKTSKVGFIGTSGNVNFEESNSQREYVNGNYSANSSTLLESSSDVYMNPAFNSEDLNLIASTQPGAL